MKAVILCGGMGTRIRGVGDDVPKPMLRIGDRPILWHVMATYARFGITEFVLCLGYRGWLIKEFFLNYQAVVSDLTLTVGDPKTIHLHERRHLGDDWVVTLAETGESTQTAGRLWQVRDYLQGEKRFCLTYGDGVGDVDLDTLLGFHDRHGLAATVTGVRPPGRFGVIEVDRRGSQDIVTSFKEKSHAEQGWINGGYFVFEDRIWDYLSDDPTSVLEHAPLETLARDGQLAMYPHERFWQCMDTYRDWRLLNDMWDERQTPWLS